MLTKSEEIDARPNAALGRQAQARQDWPALARQLQERPIRHSHAIERHAPRHRVDRQRMPGAGSVDAWQRGQSPLFDAIHDSRQLDHGPMHALQLCLVRAELVEHVQDRAGARDELARLSMRQDVGGIHATPPISTMSQGSLFSGCAKF